MPDKEGKSPLEETRMYRVELWTLLGRRAGSLMLHMSSGCFSGMLSLMRSDNPVRGQVSADGRCTLSGSIRTRVSTYPMTGEGLLFPERLELLLHCAGMYLPLQGKRREE